MSDEFKSKDLLLKELVRLRERNAELESLKAERDHALEALQESEDKLSQIVHANSIATFVIDSKHMITHWNRACENLSGISAESVLGTKKQWRAFYSSPKPVMADIMVDKVPEAELTKYYGDRGKKSSVIEGAYEAEDFFPDLGEGGKWLFFTASPLTDFEGNITGAIETLQDVTERKLAEEALRTEVANLERELKERYHFQSILGKNRKMQQIYCLIEDLADTDTTVLITGESGTGKELVARALHYSGLRASERLVTLNCSAISENLLESELFGHVKGAFTGAVKDKVGRFQLAHGGTILLDEIGDISPRIQLRLLRVLQEKEFERVGDAEPVKVDVRVLAATNQNLLEKVRRGEFREDLYYRLNVVGISLPPLRERLDDIPLLVNHCIDLFNGNLKKNIRGVAPEALKIFMHYPWPGNIRELEHALEHAFILCHGHTITADHLPPEIMKDSPVIGEPLSKKGLAGRSEDILKALNRTAGNKAKAARILGISRTRLYQLLKKHQISFPRNKV